jgi:hypothetical protein
VHALARHVHGGRVVMALPVTIVDRTELTIATWIAPGTPIVYPDGLDDGRLRPLASWGIVERVWKGEGRLELTSRTRPHSIRLFWDGEGTFRGWYVNLQAPLRETPFGFDTTDWQLDLWIEPDGAVQWKDEDHLEQAVELRIMAPAEAEEARREAARVLDEWPFPTGWEDWRPDPSWPLPALPEGWDLL